MGINIDLSTEEGFYNYYSTPYLIWANEAAKEVAGNDFVGYGDSISACFLMEQLFELCGWEGNEFMQASKEMREYTNVWSTATGYFAEAGLSQTLSDAAQIEAEDFIKIEYYMKTNFLYHDLK